MEDPERGRCTMCGKPTVNHCKACQSAVYCSHECQKSDWPVHKLLCASFKEHKVTPRPTSNHVRALHFPIDGPLPKFVWLRLTPKQHRDDEDPMFHAEKSEFLGDDFTNRIWCQANSTRGRAPRKNMVIVHIREAASPEGLQPNKAVFGIAKGRYLNFGWPGPLLAIKYKGISLTADPPYLDVDMIDVRDIVDLICSYPDVNINFAKPEAFWTTQGVRINCPGEQILYRRPKFESVKVPNDWEGFTAPISPISRLVGLPVRAYPASTYKLKIDHKVAYNHSSRDAALLYQETDPRSPNWGWAPLERQEPMGNMILVREDCKPLLIEHAQALCEYDIERVADLFQKSFEDPSKKPMVLKALTKEAFQTFWWTFDDRRTRNDANAKAVKSPV